MDITAELGRSDGSGAALFFVAMAIALYLLPTIIAFKRGVPNRGSVAVVNIFLGWTFVGWISALAMASGSRGQVIEIHNHAPQQAAPMPFPSGWYPDPSGIAGAERFFDGVAWTPSTRPAAIY